MLASKAHTVTFFASHEVDSKIKEMVGDGRQLGSAKVLQWVKANSDKAMEDGLVYWATAGVNYVRKRAAERTFRNCKVDSFNLTSLIHL